MLSLVSSFSHDFKVLRRDLVELFSLSLGRILHLDQESRNEYLSFSDSPLYQISIKIQEEFSFLLSLKSFPSISLYEMIFLTSNLLGVFRDVSIQEILELFTSLQKDVSIMRNISITTLSNLTSIPLLNFFELLTVLHSSSTKILKAIEENTNILESFMFIQEKALIQNMSILTSPIKKVSKILSSTFSLTNIVTNSGSYILIMFEEFLHLTITTTIALSIQKTFAEALSFVSLCTHPSTIPLALYTVYLKYRVGYYYIETGIKTLIAKIKFEWQKTRDS
jgi:hypothetical protein